MNTISLFGNNNFEIKPQIIDLTINSEEENLIDLQQPLHQSLENMTKELEAVQKVWKQAFSSAPTHLNGVDVVPTFDRFFEKIRQKFVYFKEFNKITQPN